VIVDAVASHTPNHLSLRTNLEVLSGLQINCSTEVWHSIEMRNGRYMLNLNYAEYLLPLSKKDARLIVEDGMPRLESHFLDLLVTILTHPCWKV
jgi:hypothetical protein